MVSVVDAVGTGKGWRSLPPWASEKRAGSAKRQGAPCTTSATMASACDRAGADAGDEQQLGEVGRAAVGGGGERAVQAAEHDVLGPDVVVRGHDEVRQERRAARRAARSQVASSRSDAVGAEVGEERRAGRRGRARRGGR